MFRIKINPVDLSTLPQGQVDHARLDATSEEDIRNQQRQDDAGGNAHIGSTLDSFLETDGILGAVTLTARQRVELLKSGTERDFFRRGREIAQAADLGEPLPENTIKSFEDSGDLMDYLQQEANQRVDTNEDN